jgi:hypothetical protein
MRTGLWISHNKALLFSRLPSASQQHFVCIATTGWSKSHATHTRVLADGPNSIQSYCTNKRTHRCDYTRAHVTSRHVVTCSCLLLSCPSSVKCRGVFFRSAVFTVQHYPAYRSCWVSGRMSRLSRAKQIDRQYLVWPNVWVTQARGGHFQHSTERRFLLFDSNVILLFFLTNITRQEWVAWLFDHLYIHWDYVNWFQHMNFATDRSFFQVPLFIRCCFTSSTNCTAQQSNVRSQATNYFCYCHNRYLTTRLVPTMTTQIRRPAKGEHSMLDWRFLQFLHKTEFHKGTLVECI